MDTAKKLEERNAFENWAADDMRLMADCNSWDVGANGSYLNPFMDAAWRGFKAGRALSTPAAADAPAPAALMDEQAAALITKASGWQHPLSCHFQIVRAVERAHGIGAPRFSKTSCSQCGGDFGPGDHGYSHCEDHRRTLAASQPAPVTSSTDQLRALLDEVNKTDSARWEVGFRNIVAILHGPRYSFEIKDVVEDVRKLAAAPMEAQAVPEGDALDAKRYRWLRNEVCWDVLPCGEDDDFAEWRCLFGSPYGMRDETQDNLDEAVDAAMLAAAPTPSKGEA